MTTATMLERARTFEAELIALRRDLHRHPELSYQEERTSGIAADAVTRQGFAVRRGVARTGVVAEMENGEGPVVALRADMDALPIQEASELDYRSTVEGVMHACGHDAHVAVLVGAARLLAEARSAGALPPGRIRLLFQPAEEMADAENKSGAVRMLEEGALDRVAAIFGFHMGPHLRAGRIYINTGAVMAGADTVRARVLGRSAHAARPERGADAVVLAAHAVLACQSAVARRLPALAAKVLTLGTVQGGVAHNVLAERVDLEGTIRYLDHEVRELLHAEVRRAFSVVDALGGRAEVEIQPGYPPLHNDAALAALARRAVAGALGEDVPAEMEPFLGAEDFAFYTERCPGCFLWIGAALDDRRELHHPRFDIEEGAIVRGACALAACAVTALQEAGSSGEA